MKFDENYKFKQKNIFVVAVKFRLLPHKFISEFDFRPRKLLIAPRLVGTAIRDSVRPRSNVGSGKRPRIWLFCLIQLYFKTIFKGVFFLILFSRVNVEFCGVFFIFI